jgi:hypothetical protein
VQASNKKKILLLLNIISHILNRSGIKFLAIFIPFNISVVQKQTSSEFKDLKI